MILRLRIVKCLINGILAEPSHIVKETDDLRKRRIVRRASEVLRKGARIRGHIAGVNLLEPNPEHHIVIVRVIGTHIGVHPRVHLMQDFVHIRSSFHIIVAETLRILQESV